MIRKVVKITAWLVATLASIAILAFLVIKLISDEQYKEWIVLATESATGRDFSIGEFSLDLNTSLLVRASDVRMANAPWSDRGDMVAMGQVEVEIDLLALLKGTADVRVVVQKADILIESDEAGNSNWSIVSVTDTDDNPHEPADSDNGFDGLPLHPLIREIRFEDINITLVQSIGEEKKIQLHSLLIETPVSETTLNLTADVDDIPVQLYGKLGDIESLLGQSGNSVHLEGKFAGNSFDISGEVGPLLPDANLSLKLDIYVPSTSNLASLAGLSLDNLGELRLVAQVSAVNGHFSISRIIADLDGNLAAASIKGSMSNVLGLDGLDLTTRADTTVLNQLLKNLHLKIPVVLPPDVQVSAQIKGGLDPLGIQEFKIRILDDGLEIALSGSVANALELKGVDGEFSIKADATGIMSKYAGIIIPNLGALSVTGSINSSAELLQLSNLDARIISDNINVHVTGGISDLLSNSGINLDIKTNISTLTAQNIADFEQLLEHFDVKVPLELLPQTIDLSATLAGDLDQMELNDIQLKVTDEGIVVLLDGSITNVLSAQGINASVDLDADSTSVISKYAGTEIPDLGPIYLTAILASTENSYTLEKLNAAIGTEEFEINISASIDNLIEVTGVQAQVDATISSLSSISNIAHTELPQTDPVTLHAEIKGEKGGAERGAKFNVEINSGSIKALLNGFFGDIKSAQDLQLQVNITADTLSAFNQFAGKELPEDGPFSLGGSVVIQPANYSLDDFQLLIGEQSAHGKIGISLAQNENELSTVKGEINIPYLDLSPYLIIDAKGDKQVEDVATQAESGVSATEDDSAEPDDIDEVATDRLFSTDPIPVDQLRLIDVEFSINSDKLIIGKTDISDLNIDLSLKNGMLRIDPITALGGTGTIDGKVTVDSTLDVTELDVDIVLDSIPMPNLGGELNLDFDLDGKGLSVADIMGSLNGELLVAVQDGIIEHSFVTNFGSGLFSFSGNKDTTALECGILRMDITDGVADFDNKLAVQMTDVTWRGGGEINFKTEKLGVGITPIPRKGLGVGLGTLASLVYIGGTLKEPKARINPKDVAVKYGKYMAFLSTGGLSLVAEALVNKARSNQDVCEKILDGTVFDEDPDNIGETGSDDSEIDSTTVGG